MLLVACLATAGAALPLQAQARVPSPRPSSASFLLQETTRPVPPARAFVYSAVLPGAGQYALGQRRWVAYVAAEALAWWFWVDRRGRGFDLRDAYRDLAWETARSRSGTRVDGDFHYYETLAYWTRSGRWDRDPSSLELEPETDATTYNGSTWLLARQIYTVADAAEPSDTAYATALDYYRRRAYGPQFLWDWSGHEEAHGRFLDLVEESDDRLREATITLGLVAANHVLSAADAFVSARLAEATGGRVDATLGLAPLRGVQWAGRTGRVVVPPLLLSVHIRH